MRKYSKLVGFQQSHTSKKSGYFTKKEWVCLKQLLKYYSAKHSALELGISPKTVETHLQSIRNKLDCITGYLGDREVETTE